LDDHGIIAISKRLLHFFFHIVSTLFSDGKKREQAKQSGTSAFPVRLVDFWI
jgi:hypothetical protein